MRAALEYGLFTRPFYDSLSPEERILGDHYILNSLIQADNEAQKKAIETTDDEKKGIVRRFGVKEALERQKEREAKQ